MRESLPVGLSFLGRVLKDGSVQMFRKRGPPVGDTPAQPRHRRNGQAENPHQGRGWRLRTVKGLRLFHLEKGRST